ncbi:hypothetical protein OAK97_00620 [bacterium]|nr:hypothetical protein [bacterium]
MVPYIPEIICPHCGGKSFRKNMYGNNICVRCQRHPAGGSADDGVVSRILEPLGWLFDNHPVVFWSLLIGAFAVLVYIAELSK